MKINISFKEFKKNHSKKKHQILFRMRSCKEYYKVENLFKFLLAEKNSFIFESVEKGTIKGRYTIIGLNPDKIWDINKNIITLNSSGKKTKIKSEPLKYINKLIKEFNIKIPKQLPSMASMLVGYFSYDVIRYIEKIPNRCKDDLNIPDVSSILINYIFGFIFKSTKFFSKNLQKLRISISLFVFDITCIPIGKF